VNKDGLIDYNEFISMMKNNSEYSSALLTWKKDY
jgi:hypothetical protein